MEEGHSRHRAQEARGSGQEEAPHMGGGETGRPRTSSGGQIVSRTVNAHLAPEGGRKPPEGSEHGVRYLRIEVSEDHLCK